MLQLFCQWGPNQHWTLLTLIVKTLKQMLISAILCMFYLLFKSILYTVNIGKILATELFRHEYCTEKSTQVLSPVE